MTKRSVNGITFTGIVAFSRVLAAFNRGPIKMQRDHRKRAAKADYIGKVLSGDQCLFHIVLWEGVERLLDGYTRVQRILEKLTDRPDSVVVIVHEETSTERELMALYDQFNSPISSKKSSDRFDEGLRIVDLLDQLDSQLVLKGTKSSPKVATDAKSIRDGVMRCEQGIRFVDSLKLVKNGETVGMLAAYYALGQHAEFLEDDTESFIRKMNQAEFAPRAMTPANAAVKSARDFQASKKTGKSATGAGNVLAIRDKVLTSFVVAMGLGHFVSGGPRSITLADFIEVMTKARAAMHAV